MRVTKATLEMEVRNVSYTSNIQPYLSGSDTGYILHESSERTSVIAECLTAKEMYYILKGMQATGNILKNARLLK